MTRAVERHVGRNIIADGERAEGATENLRAGRVADREAAQQLAARADGDGVRRRRSGRDVDDGCIAGVHHGERISATRLRETRERD